MKNWVTGAIFFLSVFWGKEFLNRQIQIIFEELNRAWLNSFFFCFMFSIELLYHENLFDFFYYFLIDVEYFKFICSEIKGRSCEVNYEFNEIYFKKKMECEPNVYWFDLIFTIYMGFSIEFIEIEVKLYRLYLNVWPNAFGFKLLKSGNT